MDNKRLNEIIRHALLQRAMIAKTKAETSLGVLRDRHIETMHEAQQAYDVIMERGFA